MHDKEIITKMQENKKMVAVIRLWSLMRAVAIVAISLAVLRAESARGVGTTIIVGCAIYLPYRKYLVLVKSSQEQHSISSPLQKTSFILISISFAIFVIGLSDLAFLIGYFGYLGLANRSIRISHWTPYMDPLHITAGVVTGVLFALSVASSLRQMFTARDLKLSRWWLKVWPVCIIVGFGILWGTLEMSERYSFCTMMVNYHKEAAVRADNGKEAALHEWYAQWYDRAATRPWLPIHPSQIRQQR